MMNKEEKEVVVLRPSDIRYTQSSISNRFTNGGLIGELLDDIVVGRYFLTSIKRIEVKLVEGLWFSADNRRLWVFKQLEFLGHCPAVPVKVVKYVPGNKYSTENEGRDVTIRGGEPGGKWFSKIQDIKQKQAGNGSNVASTTDRVSISRATFCKNLTLDSSSIDSSKYPVFNENSIQYTRINGKKTVTAKAVGNGNGITHKSKSDHPRKLSVSKKKKKQKASSDDCKITENQKVPDSIARCNKPITAGQLHLKADASDGTHKSSCKMSMKDVCADGSTLIENSNQDKNSAQLVGTSLNNFSRSLNCPGVSKKMLKEMSKPNRKMYTSTTAREGPLRITATVKAIQPKRTTVQCPTAINSDENVIKQKITMKTCRKFEGGAENTNDKTDKTKTKRSKQIKTNKMMSRKTYKLMSFDCKQPAVTYQEVYGATKCDNKHQAGKSLKGKAFQKGIKSEKNSLDDLGPNIQSNPRRRRKKKTKLLTTESEQAIGEKQLSEHRLDTEKDKQPICDKLFSEIKSTAETICIQEELAQSNLSFESSGTKNEKTKRRKQRRKRKKIESHQTNATNLLSEVSLSDVVIQSSSKLQDIGDTKGRHGLLADENADWNLMSELPNSFDSGGTNGELPQRKDSESRNGVLSEVIETILDSVGELPCQYFCPENVVGLFNLLSIIKCTSDYFYHGNKHYES